MRPSKEKGDLNIQVSLVEVIYMKYIPNSNTNAFFMVAAPMVKVSYAPEIVLKGR